jgi:hypothetical protein
MKNILQTIVKYTIWAFIFAASSYVYAVGTWNEPTGTPPADNVDAPINTGTDSQTKDGFLWVSGLGSNAGGFFATNVGIGVSSSTDPDDLGLTLVVGGNVGAEQYCDENGENCVTAASIYNAVNGSDDGLTCPSTPTKTTMGPGPRETAYLVNSWYTPPGGGISYSYDSAGTNMREGYASFTIPASTLTACQTEIGCVIKEKVYKKTAVSGASPAQYTDKLYKIKTYSYIQASSGTTQTWTSSYGTGVNGNTASTNIITPITYLYLRDDAVVANVINEQSVGWWSSYDNTAGYGREIYICTYSE